MTFTGFKRKIPFLWVEGMAIYPFIFLKKGSAHPVLINHECIHLRQQLEMGLILFYLWYAVEYIFRRIQYRNHHLAYRNISFEREAYQEEKNAAYLKNRRFWAFLKYLHEPSFRTN